MPDKEELEKGDLSDYKDGLQGHENILFPTQANQEGLKENARMEEEERRREEREEEEDDDD